MPDIFTVEASDAKVIQQHYEQVIEALLRTLLDAKEKNNDKQGLQIFDNDRLIYGREGNQFRDEVSSFSGQLLNPDIIIELQQLRAAKVGDVVEGAANKRVELDGQVVLQSDENGKVVVNTLLQQEAVQTRESQTARNNENQAPTDNQQIITITPGSTRVTQSLKALEDSPLKTLLNTSIQQLQAEIKALQEERNQYQELIQRRLQQPQNTSWWQQSINNMVTVLNSIGSAMKMSVREYKDNSDKRNIATTLKDLFDLQAQPGANQYQAGDYQISRNGSLYEVNELATGASIMKFRSTPNGVKVEQGDLESVHLKNINALQHSFERNEPIPASFAPVGKQEAEYFARVEKITNALVQYAVAQQKEVKIDGVFSYTWQASPDGKVSIYAKDGRGTLLEKSGGQLKTNMSERDLIYFEQILPKLQPARRQQEASTTQSQKAANNQLSR
ncbi:hypothetical protein DSM106972_067370 [Dulcicalothrix desertica PCC 7102]|uniref:Uncharacterized protein n=1 Tax=Dulcicalothrix desertica PCC 7102 TaxID=232991 RepID=A0A3S1CHK1_9CYAN|nr:hypothetical protein [Dulcicalothrix desertica]RUT01640.1 hypothetical protein DSM106972_067370 [Dulcicalothrix desertica PCC 7102]TWH43842.1 hypothetical protein CAL7102_07586 [Dulcicalothrix desertica PCC 7102]